MSTTSASSTGSPLTFALCCKVDHVKSRYLYQTNVMDDTQKLSDVNTVAVDTVEHQDPRAELKVSVLYCQANLYESIGMMDPAIEWNKEAYEIRLQRLYRTDE